MPPLRLPWEAVALDSSLAVTSKRNGVPRVRRMTDLWDERGEVSRDPRPPRIICQVELHVFSTRGEG
jgi:hypothetical protein